MYAATIITISAIAMLTVKKVSSIHDGNGSTIMARMATTSSGAAAPLRCGRLRVSQLASGAGRYFRYFIRPPPSQPSP